MLQLGNISAWVSIDDKELPQYAIERSADGQKITCWIPSEAGKNFAVMFIESARSTSIQGSLIVDGVHCRALAIRKERSFQPWKLEGIRTSPTTQRRLLFSRMQLTDDDAFLSAPATPQLGDIELKISEIQYEGYTTFEYCALPEIHQTIHERSKKGTTHCLGLGDDAKQASTSHKVKTKHVRDISTFIFRYRPLEVLQANGIAPIEKKHTGPPISNNTAASPVQKKRKRPSSNDTMNTNSAGNTPTDEFAEKIRKMESELNDLKQAYERSHKKVKTEVKSEPRSSQWQPNEIIDLT